MQSDGWSIVQCRWCMFSLVVPVTLLCYLGGQNKARQTMVQVGYLAERWQECHHGQHHPNVAMQRQSDLNLLEKLLENLGQGHCGRTKDPKGI